MAELSSRTLAADHAPFLQVDPPSMATPSADVPRLTQYLRIAARQRWVIVASIVTAVLVGLAITLLMTPKYTAVATIEIARESNKVVNIEGVEPQSEAMGLEFYQTQYGLLSSRTLAERVAEELKLVDDKTFFQLFRVKLDKLFPLDATPPSVAREARRRKAGQVLLDHLSISPVRGSSLVNINFTSPDAAFSARVSNAWAVDFIKSNLERRFEASSYARAFLEDRLEQTRQRLETSERALVKYAAAERIINLPASAGSQRDEQERSLTSEDLALLNTSLAEATAARIQAEARWREAKPTGGATAPEALTNVAITNLRRDRAVLAAEYSKLQQQFGPDYPQVRAAKSQLADLDRSISREEGRIGTSLQQTFSEALEREEGLRARVEELKSRFLDLRRRSIQYNIYQRDVDTNRQLYEALLQRYKEIGVAGGIGTNNISLVDRAYPPRRPSSPRLLLNSLLALLAGTVVGIALALAREQVDEAISDPADVGRELGMPLLGTVPKSRDLTPVDALLDPKSSLVEAYLTVQTSLDFTTSHGSPRSLVITSTRPGEGKSTTALALARTAVRARKKVVLIDGDMRKPSAHRLLGMNNVTGLSNFLAGEASLAAILQQAEGDLFVITSGPQPPNAADLLAGDRLKALLAELMTQYDRIIIDGPPVMGLADAPLISSMVEGVVFAVEAHGSKSGLIKLAVNRLVAAHGRVLGAVLTKFEAQRSTFGYGYDYGYGYGGRSTKADAEL